MMKRKNLLLASMLSLLLLLFIIGSQVGFLSTVSGSDSQVWSCKGIYYSSPAYSVDYFQDVADKCMQTSDKVVCDAGQESSTINYMHCQQVCAYCDDDFGGGVPVDYDCEDHGLIEMSHDDMKDYYFDSMSDSEVFDKYCKEPEIITCYQCDGAELKSKTFEDTCGSGWQLNPPTCEDPSPETVVCYQCDGAELKSETFEETCGSGWQKTIPDCEDPSPPPPPPQETITCYACDPITNSLKISPDVPGDTCPDGYVETKSDCSAQEESCYQCLNGETNIDEFAVCPNGWKTYNPLNEPNCSTIAVWLRELIDFKEKPVASAFLIFAVLLLLGSIFLTVRDLTTDGKGRF